MYLNVLNRIEKLSTKTVDPNHDSPHWLFPICKDKFYGQVYFNQKVVRAHRIAWIAYNKKEIPDGLDTRHICKEKACCNPEHLTIGTRKENIQDRREQGTHTEGEMHPVSTITNEIAIQIKNSKGDGTRADRADRFNVSIYVVQNIDNGSSWKNVVSN